MTEAQFPYRVQTFDPRPPASRLQLPSSLIPGCLSHILTCRQALAADGDFAINLPSRAGPVPRIECPDRIARILARHLASADLSA